MQSLSGFPPLSGSPDGAISIGHTQHLNRRTDMLTYANVFYGNILTMKTITFRATEDKVTALDSLAEITQRDRSFILNEAVDQYLSLNDYHRELIEEGIRQVKAGRVIDHEQVKRKVASWASKGKK